MTALARDVYFRVAAHQKKRVSFRGESFLVRREKRCIHVYTFAMMNTMITSHRR